MGIRFKIANWIMRDYLRNYLIVGIKLPLLNILKYQYVDNKLSDFQEHKIKDIISTVDELFEI